MTDQPTTLNQLMRDHATNPSQRAGNRIMIHPDDLNRLPRNPARRPLWAPDPSRTIAELTGIPVFVDRSEPPGQWRLVDRDGHTRDTGPIDPTPAANTDHPQRQRP